jgi:hypothetical protein
VPLRGTALCTAVVLMVAIGGAATVADAAPASAHCTSVRLTRFYKPAANGTFGAFGITATGTTCVTARSIASTYVRNPFSVDSPKHRTKKVSGWTCTWRDNDRVSQQVSVTCTKRAARIAFADRLPNG